MNISETIICPKLSEKSNLLSTLNKYVFKVNVKSNKLQIKSASLYEQVKGFSQNICLLCFIANLRIFLWREGGVAIIIAFIFLSKINFFQFEYILIFFGILILSFFFDLKDKYIRIDTKI